MSVPITCAIALTPDYILYIFSTEKMSKGNLQFCLDSHILKLLPNIFIWCTKVGTHIIPGVM